MKKAKRYQTGGVLRDRFGNPVRSGSGDAVRTTYPERSYDEQASASMTESSDYSGRRPRTAAYSDDGMNVPHSSMPSSSVTSDLGSEETVSLADRLRRASPGSNITSMDGEGGYTSPVKEDKKEKQKSKISLRKRASQKFPVDMAGMKKRGKEAMGKETKTGSGAYGFNFKKGGKVSSASSRADGIAQRGKTKGRIC